MKSVKTALSQLPQPNDEQKALSRELSSLIKRRIRLQGSISFASFMEMSLYEPGLGYYANGLKKFGRGGDFVTAPEISPLFGQVIARQLVEVLLRLEKGSVLELGAGSGALAESVLLTMEELDCLPEQYCILEPSAGLQLVQAERLKAKLPQHLWERLVWLQRLPENFVGVVVGNEVVDALPVDLLRLYSDKVEQGYVAWDETQSRFDWDWQPVMDDDLRRYANRVLQFIGSTGSKGYVTEVRPMLGAWMAALSESMDQGMILLVDYGYVRQEYLSPQRWMGSLRAHYQHRAHNDPFWFPGLQDLTSHVDFTALAESGHAAGFTVSGFTTQANFLLSNGLLECVDPNADVVTHLKLAQQVKTLTMPDEMGENFKVIAFSKGVLGRLNGFCMRDLREYL